MDDIWTQPLSPIPQIETSPASATTPASFPPEIPECKPHQLITAIACVESAIKGKRKRSPYWAHFDKILKDGLQKAVCKYCSRLIGCDPKSGTSALKNHIERCKEYPVPSKLISHPVVDHYCPLAVASAGIQGKLDNISAVPWDRFPAARSVQQMMETMTEAKGCTSGRTPWAIKESEMGYKIRFDMPGMTRKDVKVWVEENALVVEAEKVPERSQDGEGDVQEDEWPVESYGKYYSRVELPGTVNGENIKAEVKDGVLQVAVPKVRATNRRLEINVQ